MTKFTTWIIISRLKKNDKWRKPREGQMKRVSLAALLCSLALWGTALAQATGNIAGPSNGASKEAAEPKAGNVTIFGSIKNNAGQDVCGLVLANGVFVFSCSPNGSYSLTVPLDANNQVTLFGFAEGHFPFKTVLGSSGGRYDIVLTIASASQPSNPNRDNSALLIGGTWTFTYTIISTFSDQFVFTTLDNTPDSNGNYFVDGVGPGGRIAVGEYVSAQRQWAVLWSGTIIDEFFTFTFSGNNNVSGCYYQISPPGSTNLSRCYPMVGFRSPPKALPAAPDELQRLSEAANEPPADVDASTMATYMSLARKIQR